MNNTHTSDMPDFIAKKLPAKTKKKKHTVSLTKHRKMRKNAILMALWAITATLTTAWLAYTNVSIINPLLDIMLNEPSCQSITPRPLVIPSAIPAVSAKKNVTIKNEVIREVTAYNVGDVAQTDSTPCIGAYSKVNLCEEVENGRNVCAANFVPLGTELLITAKGGWEFNCIVWDRMARKHKNRVDIAMKLSEKNRAINFGIQLLNVEILTKE